MLSTSSSPKGKVRDLKAKPTPGPLGPEYPSLASVLADGEVDPVDERISQLKGDPISPSHLTTHTSLPRFTRVRLTKHIVDMYGSMMDDSELPKEVQASLRAQPVQAS